MIDSCAACASCTHARGFHPHSGACRACACEVFLPVVAAPEPEAPEPKGPRRVTVDVPDGYVVHIELIPVTGEPEVKG